jgi:hypothetical protein
MANIIWAILSASIAFTLVYIGWLIFGYAGNQVDNSLLISMPDACINSICMGSIMSQVNGLFAAGIISTIVFIAVYLFAAAHSEEDDSGAIF